MLVYGDPARRERTRARLTRLRRDAVRALLAPSPLARRAASLRLLIAAGELEQGLADAAFEARGEDGLSTNERLASALTLEAARLYLAALAPSPLHAAALLEALGALAAARLPASITARVPEGYAFYALYPEAYAVAARALDRSRPVVVVGLRSIGTSLAAVVAAATEASVVVTLRPAGHPFDRAIRAGEALTRAMEAHATESDFAIVDEGPGLSGSSFDAAARWLVARGAEARRVHLFPGHDGEPGLRASDEARARFRSAPRHVAPWAQGFLGAPPVPHAPLDPGERIDDVSAGAWRAKLLHDVNDFPPVWAARERRKLVYRSGGRAWLAKFAGLGRYGDEALARGRALAAAGFCPPVLGLHHGFAIGPWLGEATPLPAARGLDRGDLVRRVASYLATLATLRRPRRALASPRALLAMARHNTREALGEALARELDRWEGRLDAIARAVRPVWTDGRMHAWEWIVLPGGLLLKTDAVDHGAGHDLAGTQDAAWDVAGAIVELDLDDEEACALQALACPRGPPGAELLAFHRVAYLALQTGAFTLAEQGADACEKARLGAARRRYEARLARAIVG